MDEEMILNGPAASQQRETLPEMLSASEARGLQEAHRALQAVEQARQDIAPIVAELFKKDTILEQFSTHVDRRLRLVEEHVLEAKFPQLCADMRSCQHQLTETVRLNNGFGQAAQMLGLR